MMLKLGDADGAWRKHPPGPVTAHGEQSVLFLILTICQNLGISTPTVVPYTISLTHT